MPDPVDAQNASLDAFNLATDQVNAAAQKLDEFQRLPPEQQVGSTRTQLEIDLRAAQAAAATAARQYATILQQQAVQEARANDPGASARAERAQAQAELYQAKADTFAATTEAQRQAAQKRADAALTNANSAASRVDAQNAQAQATAGHLTAQTGVLQAEQAQRERNQAAGKGALTDAELASQGLRSREVSVQEANSAIAAANSRLAAQRADIEARLDAGKLDLDSAKLEYQKVKDVADREIDQQRLAIQSAAQSSTAEYQQGQLANQQGQLAETTRSNIATEGLRTSDQARAAAGDILQAGQNAAQTGAGLLNQRTSSATSFLNTTMGNLMQSKNLGLGSTPDVSGLPAAVAGYTTQLGGGQGVYDTAAKAVNNLLPGGAGNPMAAQAYAVLHQIMDLTGGQAHPVVEAAANMPPPQQQPFQSPGQAPATPAAAPNIVFNFASPPAATGAPGMRGDLNPVQTGATF